MTLSDFGVLGLRHRIQDIPTAPKSSAGGGQRETAADTPGNRMAHLVAPPEESVPDTLKQTGGGDFTGSADELYDAIRSSKTDVSRIAQNTGIKPANIQKVKDHVFYNEHLLDEYVDYGVPAESARFDSEFEAGSGMEEAGNRYAHRCGYHLVEA